MSWGTNNLGSAGQGWGTNNLGSSGGGFSGQDWATVIGAGAGGANTALGSLAQTAASKREAREAQRRTLYRLYQNALKRRLSTFREGQEYSGDMADAQSEQLKDIARGFAGSLKGSTGRLKNV